MTVAAIIIFVFFSIYVASCFVTCGKLFNSLFGVDYLTWMIIGALIVFAYTFIGGYLSVCTTDFIQSLLMCFALVVVFVGSVASIGGVENTATILTDIPGYISATQSASPLESSGFAEPVEYGFVSIISALA